MWWIASAKIPVWQMTCSSMPGCRCQNHTGKMSRMMTCSDCLCYYCLYYWSERCPYGACYDDHRAQADPYTDHYPERHLWSDSHKPGEQAHWCRGGNLYPTEECPYFEQYERQKIEQCYRAMISTFQDGYRSCPMMVNGTCEKCLRDLNEAIQGG